MLKILKFFNLFSQTPQLKISGENRPFSIFGGIVGFFSISFLIAGITFILYEFFSRFQYTIESYTDNLEIPNIDLKNFKLGFSLYDLMGKKYPDQERLYKISARHWDIYIPKFGSNKTDSVKVTNIPMIKCNEYKNDSLFYEDFNIYSHVSCLDFSNLNKNLSGIYGNAGR